MNRHTSKITNKSIEQSGLPNDYKKSIAEYIWNGFDARATTISLDFEGNELGYLSSFSISDNGTGIDPETIDDTFGNFLDSRKRDPFNKESYQRNRKGKGRYAFSTFANKCKWQTRFEAADGKIFKYDIVINKGDLQYFVLEDKKLATNTTTGTVVSFHDFFNLSSTSLLNKEFKDYLSSEFGWFLFLNRERNYKILINGIELAYDEIIGDSEELIHEIGEDAFKIIFIRWNQKIGDKYYFYFIGSNRKEAVKKHTSFNNKAIDFHHSVYVTSTFFNDFNETTDDSPVLDFSGKNQSHLSFKSLLKTLNSLTSEKEKHYIRDIQADRLIQDYQDRGVIPEFKIKADGLEHVVKEIYCAEPRIFQTSNNQQCKALVGLLNLVLATGHSDSIIEVIESIVELTDEEKENINRVL